MLWWIISGIVAVVLLIIARQIILDCWSK